MNQENNLSVPRENTAAANLLTRRSFLKLAGASVLSLPFLKPEEVLATPNYKQFLPGVSYGRAPNYKDAGIHVYTVHFYCLPGHVPTKWPRFQNPDGTYSNVLLTVYPTWATFISKNNTGYNDEFKQLAASAHRGDMISCYQEPENIHHYDANHVSITPWKIQKIQWRMLSIAHNLHGFTGASGHMRVGAIAFHRRSWRGNWFHNPAPQDFKATDFMMHGLDWYGLDCYRAHISYDQVGIALAAYKDFADNYGGSGCSVCVPECNAPAYLDSKRQFYFQKIADHVAQYSSAGYGAMCTFWNKTGADSGPWNTQYVGKPFNKVRQGAGPNTRHQLKLISQM
jgi:hypothetical protein